MKIIAHGITNSQSAIRAIENKIDFLEVDVSQRFFFSKFTTQHHGILGKFGIGQKLELLLGKNFQKKLFLDIKHAKYSLNFTSKLNELLEKSKVKTARLCGFDWKIISAICKKHKLLPYYSVNTNKDIEKIKKLIASLEKPAGFSVKYKIISEEFIKSVKETFGQTVEVWAWTVNDSKEAKRLTKLGVDGVITDEWKKVK